MGKCVIYLQLFVCWIILNISTFALTLVPHSPRFLNIAPTILESEKFVVYGLWVLVEIAIFFILLVSATIIVCSCKNVPAGVGFVHMMVDPAFVCLGCTPFIIIRGLPRASEVQICLDMLPTGLNKSMLAKSALGCLPFNPTAFINGSAHLATNGDHGHNFVIKIPESNPFAMVKEWTTVLQGALLVPVMIRMVHYRWKMSWQPFIHSNLYFFIQALDIMYFIDSSVHVSAKTLSTFIYGAIYISSLALSLGCLTISMPPMYVGNHITNKFLKTIAYLGILCVDLPFFILRCILLDTGRMPDYDGTLYVILMKNIFSLVSLICLWLKRASLCMSDTYESLNMPDPEVHDCDDEAHEMEEYV